MSSTAMLRVRTALVTAMLSLMLCAAVSAGAVPYADEVIHAGETVAGMNAQQLLGTIAIMSMLLAALLGYLLYRSQRELWTRVILELEKIVHKGSQ